MVALSLGVTGVGEEKMVGFALNPREVRVGFPPRQEWRVEPAVARWTPGLDWLDCVLIGIFVLGLYTNFAIQISTKVPFPSAPAGIAGLILLWRRRDLITPKALACFLSVVALYLASMLKIGRAS